MPYELRDFQRACHDAVLATWGLAPFHDGESDTFRSTLADLPTSAGKTIVAGAILDTLQKGGGRGMFMADSDELCQQPLDKFRKAFNIFAALEKADQRASLQSDIVVASAQTLERPNRRQKFPPGHFRAVIVDEAHRGSDRNKAILDDLRPEYILGITGTAFRRGTADLAEYYESVAFKMGLFDSGGNRGMINLGYVTPVKVLTVPISIDLNKVKVRGGDFVESDLSDAVTPYFEAIVQAILEHAAKRQIIAFLPLIASSKKFVEIARSYGLVARHIDGTSEDRRHILESFARSEFQLLSCSMLLTTGWDCHAVDCLLNLRPTKSSGLYRQMVGRIIRVLEGVIDGLPTPAARRAAIAASGKPDSLILDVLWQYEDLALASPASLLDLSDEDTEALNKKLRAGDLDPEELAELSAQVQAEREQQLIEELKSKAARASRLMDARQLALMLHQMELIDYRPQFKWESRKLSEGQLGFLSRNAIDPEGVRDRGHASRIIDAVKKAEAGGMASPAEMIALKTMGIEPDAKITHRLAVEKLGEQLPMPFGKHAGRPIGHLPQGYLNWLSEQAWLSKWPDVAAFVARHASGAGAGSAMTGRQG